MTGTALAAAVAVALVTYDEVHNLNRMPCPARYVLVLALFAGIGVLTARYPALGSAMAWALVIGILIGDQAADSPLGEAVGTVTRRPAKHPKSPKDPTGRKRGGKQV